MLFPSRGNWLQETRLGPEDLPGGQPCAVLSERDQSAVSVQAVTILCRHLSNGISSNITKPSSNMAAGMASKANGPDRPATGEAVFSLLGRLELLQRLVAPPGASGAALLPSSLPAAES